MILSDLHRLDAEGRPAGGEHHATGLFVSWQAGPLAGGKQTGAFVEDVIRAAVLRLEFHQHGPGACGHNADAIEHLQKAIAFLEARTADRVARGVEGTYQP